MRRKVKPHRDAAPRTYGVFRREVAALLAAKGMSGEEATRTVLRWDDYVKARWAAGKPPCAVSDHLMRWSKEKIVCPCKRGGDPSPRCKVHGKRRSLRARRDPGRDEMERHIVLYLERLYSQGVKVYSIEPSGAGVWKVVFRPADKPSAVRMTRHLIGSTVLKKTSNDVSKRRRVRRDADNPRPGEVYEAKTSGRRWEVVSVDGERVTMRPVGARSDGRLVFAKSSLKGMKIMKSAVDSLLTSILGPRIEPKIETKPDDAEARLARKAAIERELAKTKAFAGDPAGRRKKGGVYVVLMKSDKGGYVIYKVKTHGGNVSYHTPPGMMTSHYRTKVDGKKWLKRLKRYAPLRGATFLDKSSVSGSAAHLSLVRLGKAPLRARKSVRRTR